MFYFSIKTVCALKVMLAIVLVEAKTPWNWLDTFFLLHFTSNHYSVPHVFEILYSYILNLITPQI